MTNYCCWCNLLFIFVVVGENNISVRSKDYKCETISHEFVIVVLLLLAEWFCFWIVFCFIFLFFYNGVNHEWFAVFVHLIAGDCRRHRCPKCRPQMWSCQGVLWKTGISTEWHPQGANFMWVLFFIFFLFTPLVYCICILRHFAGVSVALFVLSCHSLEFLMTFHICCALSYPSLRQKCLKIYLLFYLKFELWEFFYCNYIIIFFFFYFA